jgi:hypothetical protein
MSGLLPYAGPDAGGIITEHSLIREPLIGVPKIPPFAHEDETVTTGALALSRLQFSQVRSESGLINFGAGL